MYRLIARSGISINDELPPKLVVKLSSAGNSAIEVAEMFQQAYEIWQYLGHEKEARIAWILANIWTSACNTFIWTAERV